MSNIPMTRPEEMLAEHLTPFFHDSSFIRLQDGKVLHSSGGLFNFSEDRGISWSEPATRKDNEGNPVGARADTSLVNLAGNGIGLTGRISEKGGYYMVFWRSEDGGKTWEPPIRLTPPGMNTAAYQDVFLRTSSGRIVLPVYSSVKGSEWKHAEKSPLTGKLLNGQFVSTAAHWFDYGLMYSFVVYSDDDGRTWRRNRDGDLMILLGWNGPYSGVGEPSVTETAPGTLLMMMRCNLGRLFQAWSYDNGETWTRPQPTPLASSPAPAQIRTLPNGHLLVVWSQESPEENKQGYNRLRLSSAVSRNGGSVWEFFQNVESIFETTRVEPGPIEPLYPAELSYPPGMPAPERNPEFITPVSSFGRWSYPSVFVMEDRVFIATTYSMYEEHPSKAELILTKKSGKGANNQKLKILPLKWFYGGKEPADNPFLPRAYEPAQP